MSEMNSSPDQADRSGEPVLSVRGVSKSYGAADVLHEINLDLSDGEFIVLVGPSGCGKSTLLSCIAGLSEVSGGSLHIAGRDVTQLKPAERNIAMVFQSYALFPNLNVAQNIGFGLDVQKTPRAVRDAAITEVAELLNMEHLLDRRPAHLSGGQRQRVAMGRALVRQPALFLFDEPLSNLDSKLRLSMRTEIKRLHHRLDASIIYVTHDQIEAMTLATRIVVMREGKTQQIGTPREVYDNPVNTFVADFMGSPSMNLIPARVSLNNGRAEICISRDQGQEDLVLYDPTPPPIVSEARGREIVVGIRPEAMTGREHARADTQVQTCRLDVVEPAGSDTFATISLAGTEAVARFHGDAILSLGEPVDVAFDLSKICYFDADTGVRL